ncbi:TonB-dependent receptor [Leptobacterium sp. I13]|uniref:TonB-dependent receptor n=1 Tax=Leptobacterium meishanense TaxID=3128904 RepID=UPI0030EB7308
MQRYLSHIIHIVALFPLAIYSQDKNIKTEEVTIVKPYSPTILDASKIKEIPVLNDSIITAKKEINYTIFSVPVASTFTPAKGKASGVKRAPREKLYNTYAAIGFGNYNTAQADFYTGRTLGRDETIDISFNHHSSQGGIDNVLLDDKFFKTKLEGTYKKHKRDMYWSAWAGAQHQIYNWYGLPNQVTFDEITLNSIEERQTYYDAYVGMDIALENAFFKGGDILLRHFWDAEKSNETRFVLKPSFEIPLSEQSIIANFTADYLNGGFDQSFFTEEENNYNMLLLGANPNISLTQEDITLNLGASIYYMLDVENSDNDFFIYPQVTASYRLVEEYVTVYGGIEGTLQQNSYHGFVKDNQFLAPTLNILPTDKQYDAYVGMKGKLSSNIGYDIKGSYIVENNKPLFQLNPLNAFSNPNNGYAYGNTFNVVYDDVKTIAISGALDININSDFMLGVNAELFDYNMDEAPTAWNLPTIKASIFLDYQIGDRWAFGATILYMGEREDIFTPDNFGNPFNNVTPQLITLGSYFDVNTTLNYKFDDQLSAFMRLNNIAGNEYARWANYPVQGFQLVAGAIYKFDF